MVAVAAAMKRALTGERKGGSAIAALSNDIVERSELLLYVCSIMLASLLACLLALPPSFLSPASVAINSFAFAVKCFACLMSLTFHSDDSFSFCSVDMSTPCMSDVSHVHDPFGRGFFALLPACLLHDAEPLRPSGWFGWLAG